MGLFRRMLLPKKGGLGKRVPKKGGLGKTETADGKTNASRVPKKGKGGLGKTKTAGGKTNASRVPKKGKGRLGKTDSSLQLATSLATKFEHLFQPPHLWAHRFDIYHHDECVKDEKMARDLEYKQHSTESP